MDTNEFINEYGSILKTIRPIIDLKPEISRNWQDAKGEAMKNNIEHMRKKYITFMEETFNMIHVLEQADSAGEKLNSFGWGMHGGSAFSLNQLFNAVDVKIKSWINMDRMP